MESYSNFAFDIELIVGKILLLLSLQLIAAIFQLIVKIVQLIMVNALSVNVGHT